MSLITDKQLCLSTTNNHLFLERVNVRSSNFVCDIKTISNESKNVCGKNNYTDQESDNLPFQGKTSKIHYKADTNCVTYEDDVVIPIQVQAQESIQNEPERQVQTQLRTESKLWSNSHPQGQQLHNDQYQQEINGTVFQDFTTSLEHGNLNNNNLVHHILSSQVQEADNDIDIDTNTNTNINSLTGMIFKKLLFFDFLN